MKPYLSMAANRAVDDYAINTCSIPGEALMQNAGNALVHELESRGFLKESLQILVLTGKGNNGGDGYVIAANLYHQGLAVSLITIADETQLHGDALIHYQVLSKLDLKPEIWQNTAEQHQLIQQADIIVDALLGTGISGSLRSPYPEIINACNQSEARIVAVDVPSGVTGDLGEILQPCIKAGLTISMGFGKQGCLFEPARSHSGLRIPVDIGFPEDSLEHLKGIALYELENSDFGPSAFTRSAATHKYSAGKVYIIAGSQGFTGAALLSATAALRAGAGLVKLALPESLGQIGETASLETIVEYMPETPNQSFAINALESLKAGCEWADAVAIGPGIGRDPETLDVVRNIITNIQCPLVIDADALFALINNLELLKTRRSPTIITPHAGEFKRLLGQPDTTVPTWQDALNFAEEYGVHVLLKGAPSILAAPTGTVSVNTTGYAGMATAGSGDILTGVIAALWAQWSQIPEVLNFAMYIHGQAADLNRSEKGVLGLIASDIVNALPEALKEYGALPT